MATPEEIQRRVADNDARRSAQRAAAAKQIGELAERRAELAEQLSDIERQLGEALVAVQNVMEIDELARFTDIPAGDLRQWLSSRTSSRTRRKRPAAGGPGELSNTSRGSAGRTPTPGRAPTTPAPAVPRADPADLPTRAPAEVA